MHIAMSSVLWALWMTSVSSYTLEFTSRSPVQIAIFDGEKKVAENVAILSGSSNDTVSPIAIDAEGSLLYQDGSLTADLISPNVARIEVNSSEAFVGAIFRDTPTTNFYGTFEYPFSGRITNEDVKFDLKGIGFSEGVNWASARAPFFISLSEYANGVYADTLQMGSYDFKIPGEASFIFNTSSLVYYIILPSAPKDVKSVITEYTKLSSSIELPSISGLGPTFWSDDFTTDFHGSVSNAEENYYDVINHLYDAQIHATSLFADRPYGTGKEGYGNFDFDPEFYPDPEKFIANLTSFGFDFQVWVANRAFPDSELFAYANERGWLFEDFSEQGGPALDLTIPEAYAYFKERLSYFPKAGVRGYKIDRGEENEMPAYEQNIQMTLFLQLCFESMVEVWGSSDQFHNFARSAVDRSRSRSHLWGGDPYATYTGLAYTVASGIRSGLIGYPIWGSDTGGYNREDNEPSEELWAHWMWFSTFSPVYELMLGTGHTPWYEPYSSDLVGVLKQTANLHAELVPYILSYAEQARQDGIPVMRALFLEEPEDTEAYEVADEYFFGDWFLVAPVVSEGETRTVYFPGEGSYLEYFDKTAVYSGGSPVEIAVSTDSVPVFVRPGTIVPRGDIYQGNNKWTEDWTPYLNVELYPSKEAKDTSFKYYTGEGQAEIKMVADCAAGEISVEYGEVGLTGEMLVFAKEKQTGKLKAEGGSVTFRDVECLF